MIRAPKSLRYPLPSTGSDNCKARAEKAESDLTAARAEIEQLNALLKNARSGAQAWIKAHDTIDAALQAAQSEVSALKEEVGRLKGELAQWESDNPPDYARIASLQSLIAEKDAVLERAAEQFEFYVVQHLAKMPPDTAKAATNEHFAVAARTALNSTEAKTGGESHAD